MLMALGVFDVTLDRRVLPPLVCSRGGAPDHDCMIIVALCEPKSRFGRCG